MTTEWFDVPEDPASTQRLDPVGEEQLLTERVKTPLLGIVAFGLAVLAAAFQICGIVAASSGAFGTATVFAWAAVGASVLAVVIGVIAIVGDFGRRWGIAAVVLGLIANPWLLQQVLALLGGGAA